MSFSKLESKIIHSSIWSEPESTRIVWITFLALKDESGFVAISPSGMRRACNLIDDKDGSKFDKAILCLQSPDPESITEDFEGRRIEKIEGGWIVLNHDKYRLHDDIQRDKTRERVRKHRELKRNKMLQPVTVTFPSVSVSVSESESKEGSAEGRMQQRHGEFLSAGPAEWIPHDYQSGQAWLRTFKDCPHLSPDNLIAAAKAYCVYCDDTDTRDQYVKRPQNWLRDGDWAVDWTKQSKRHTKKKKSLLERMNELDEQQKVPQ